MQSRLDWTTSQGTTGGGNAHSRIGSDLCIIQYNCGNANYRLAKSLFDQLDPERHHVIAVQEPYFNEQARTTYCPPGYNLCYQPSAQTRVCTLVSKKLRTQDWSFEALHNDIAIVSIRTQIGRLDIINVYNPTPTTPQSLAPTRLPEIGTALTQSRNKGHLPVLLGDLNLHHPVWGGILSATDALAEELLSLAAQHGIKLLTPQGEVTWRRGISATTIDLILADEQLSDRLHRCQSQPEWAPFPDHIPVLTSFNLQATESTHVKRFALKNLDTENYVKTLEAALQNSEWQLRDAASIDSAAEALQRAVFQSLEAHCPYAKPCHLARRAWSPECTELLREHRRARRRYTATHRQEDRDRYNQLRNQLQRQIKADSATAWRSFVEEATQQPTGLWRLSKWARKKAGQPKQLPQLPDLREDLESPFESTNEAKARLLARRFFPTPAVVDFDREATTPSSTSLSVSSAVTTDDTLKILKQLPNKKASGPDLIANEAIKAGATQIAPALAQLAQACLRLGYFPKCFRTSVTVVLRKEGKGDYSKPGSYRPIALENTLGKVLEKLVAERLTTALEEAELLPRIQMGARQGRSTTTALSLLTHTVHTVWKEHPKYIASMLSLDLSGAFDRISHPGLLQILRDLGCPGWLCNFIQSFLTDRSTRLTFGGYTSEVFPVRTGGPQGSPLLPILFVVFISSLHKLFDQDNDRVLGIGFVDDTNILVWGPSAEANCRRLESLHEQCLAWAQQYGAVFAPDKYQLIHFTRKRTADVTAKVGITGFHGEPVESLRVLGVWVDSKLRWSTHIAQAAQKGLAQYEALSRLAASTWGLTFARARLLYTAVVRPTVAYASSIWALGDSKRPSSGGSLPSLHGNLPNSNGKLQPLVQLQAKCLRKIAGAYRRTNGIALEKDVDIPPLPLYLQAQAYKHILTQRDSPPERFITQRCLQIGRQRIRERIRRRRQPEQPEQHTPRVNAQREAKQAEQEGKQIAVQQEQSRRHRPQAPTEDRVRTTAKVLELWYRQRWKDRWEKAGRNKEEPTWHTPWGITGRQLFQDLTRPEATAATLLRTEVVGFNYFLWKVGVPDATPECSCGALRQTPKHILIFCPEKNEGRAQMMLQAGSSDYRTILTTKKGIQAVARWFLRYGGLAQFARVRAELDWPNRTKEWRELRALPGADCARFL